MSGSSGSGFPLRFSAENLEHELPPFSHRRDEPSLFLQQNNAYFPQPDSTAIALKALSDQVGLVKTMLEQQQKKIESLKKELAEQKNLNRGLFLTFRRHERICQVQNAQIREAVLKTTKSQDILNGRVVAICKYFEKEAFKHQVKKDAPYV